MILSRTLAKRRIAAGVRPSRGAAWGPVMFDGACLAGLFILLWSPFQALATGLNLPLWAKIAALLAVGFIPVQAVLIISSLWATKSRWTETEPIE